MIWRADAACAGLGPAMFYPTSGEPADTDAAKQVCAACPVVAQCREVGMSERFGVWGGASPSGRAFLRRMGARRTA